MEKKRSRVREKMKCIKCKSSNIVMLDDKTAKCNNCEHSLAIGLNPETNEMEPYFAFKSEEPHFDSRKYTSDPSWMQYWERREKEHQKKPKKETIPFYLRFIAYLNDLFKKWCIKK